MSCHDLLGPTIFQAGNALMLNWVKARALPDLILESSAITENVAVLNMEDIRRLLNCLVEIQTDWEALRDMEESRSGSSAEFEFQRFMVRMGEMQILDQAVTFPNAVGRLIGRWEFLPFENQSEANGGSQERQAALARKIPLVLGASISGLALVALGVLHLYESFYASILPYVPLVPRERGGVSIRGRAAIDGLLGMLESGSFDRRLEFSRSQLLELFPMGGVFIDSYLRLFARSVSELRRLRSEGGNESRHFARGFSVFDRFCLVETSPGRYLAPNVRLIRTSFVPNVEYSLMERLGEEFLQAQGATQELYLRHLLRVRLPSYVLIAERAYGRPERRGPDLVLVDPLASGLILVESKSRRIRAGTRSILSEDLLSQNLEAAYSALRKLPKKIEALYEGIEEYQDVQGEIDKTRQSQPICVVVMNDAVMMMSELVRISIGKDSGHELGAYPYRFCILSLAAFELAVEVAFRESRSLYEMFGDHWEKSVTSSPSEASADRFGGFWPDAEPAFGSQFFREALGRKIEEIKRQRGGSGNTGD